MAAADKRLSVSNAFRRHNTASYFLSLLASHFYSLHTSNLFPSLLASHLTLFPSLLSPHTYCLHISTL